MVIKLRLDGSGRALKGGGGMSFKLGAPPRISRAGCFLDLEMRPRRGNRFGFSALPRGYRHVGDAPTLPTHLAFGIGIAKLPGTQVVEGKVDDLRHSRRAGEHHQVCLLYTSPSPRDRQKSRMPSSA